jgi:hypothetical protein
MSDAWQVSETDRRLRRVAERVAAAWVEHTSPRAILLTGSAAAGGGDGHSDIDIVAYYDAPPSDASLTAAWLAIGGDRLEGRKYWVDGVEVDGGPATIADVERNLADVLERFEARSPAQKLCEGILKGVPLHGADLIEGWQARLRAYPPELTRAMVEAHLTFWPVWRVADWLAARDMALWYHQTLLDSSTNVLGILAGINRLYYHPAYAKRLRTFVAGMRVAPARLASRLERLLTDDPAIAIPALEQVVAETLAIVEAEMPEVDTTAIRRDLGSRRSTQHG